MREIFYIVGLYIFMELGDKTMLSSVALATKYSPIKVFLGATLGITLVTALSVTLGGVLRQYLGQEMIEKVAGIIFLVMGVMILLGKL